MTEAPSRVPWEAVRTAKKPPGQSSGRLWDPIRYFSMAHTAIFTNISFVGGNLARPLK